MKIKLAAVVTGMLLVFAAVSMYAHHPFAGEFDWKKPVTLTGKVTKFEWVSPHSFLYVDGKDENGKSMSWTLEMGGPKALMSAGWTKNTLKAGDEVTVDGWLAKADRAKANVKSVTLPDGRELFAGSSISGTEKPQTRPTTN